MLPLHTALPVLFSFMHCISQTASHVMQLICQKIAKLFLKTAIWVVMCKIINICLIMCTTPSNCRSLRPRDLMVRLHWSKNRHNTANQHLSGYTSQTRVATINLICVSILIATEGLLFLSFGSQAHCSRYLSRLSARNKLSLLAPDSRGR